MATLVLWGFVLALAPVLIGGLVKSLARMTARMVSPGDYANATSHVSPPPPSGVS